MIDVTKALYKKGGNTSQDFTGAATTSAGEKSVWHTGGNGTFHVGSFFTEWKNSHRANLLTCSGRVDFPPMASRRETAFARWHNGG
jgi:hypothetical protein